MPTLKRPTSLMDAIGREAFNRLPTTEQELIDYGAACARLALEAAVQALAATGEYDRDTLASRTVAKLLSTLSTTPGKGKGQG